MEFSREKHFSQYNAGADGRQPKPGAHQLEKNAVLDFANPVSSRDQPAQQNRRLRPSIKKAPVF